MEDIALKFFGLNLSRINPQLPNYSNSKDTLACLIKFKKVII